VFSFLPATSEFISLSPFPLTVPATFRKTTTLKNQVISDLVASVSVQSLTEFLIQLTNFHTRQSTSPDAVAASTYIRQTFAKFGFNATQIPFRTGYSDNVVGERKGNLEPEKIIIIGAHYDSRMSSVNDATSRAPGANDDGSGTAALLEIARILSEPGLIVPYTIQLIAFSGEEQGLYGSYAYANAAKEADLDIIAMLQGDMLGYQSVSYYGLDFASRYTTESLTTQLDLVAKDYISDLVIGRTTSCCSDQRPFYEAGYITAKYGHAGGASSDPQYHQSGDVINRPGFTIQLVLRITQAILAGAATLAKIGSV